MVLVYIFLYLPIVTLAVFSFNNSKSMAKWSGFTLDWYYALFENEFINENNGIIINLGAGKTTISSFYKGILVNETVIRDAGINIDNDISFMYKTKLKDSKKIKEKE